MFIPFTFASVNELKHLRRGTYRAKAEYFAGTATEHKLTLITYTHWDDDEVCAVDLIGIDASGAVRVRDFIWMPDRSWRDSAGGKANNLADLLSDEFKDLSLVGRQRWPDIHLEEVINT